MRLRQPVPSKVVSLKKAGGTFVVPVQINGAITLDFTVDSGGIPDLLPLSQWDPEDEAELRSWLDAAQVQVQ
jgi:hypothetical protein